MDECIVAFEHTQSRIHELYSEATTINEEADKACEQVISLENTMGTVQREKQLLSSFHERATNTLFKLIEQVESLHKFTQDQKSSGASRVQMIQASGSRVSACKAQSGVVNNQFESLYERAKDIMDRSSQLATDFTYQASSVQTRSDKLKNLHDIADSLRNEIQDEQDNLSVQEKTAEWHIQQAEEARRRAEEELESATKWRIARDILSPLWGELLDIGGLNQTMEDAHRDIDVANANMEECKQRMQRADAALHRVEQEIVFLKRLRDVVDDQQMKLNKHATHCTDLRDASTDLTSASMKVSLFLGVLAAKGETLAIHYTAQDFAQAIQDFVKTAESEEKLDGFLVRHDPQVLQETLVMIAQSDGQGGSHDLL